MQVVHKDGQQAKDLFGLLTLQPGRNEVDERVWAKVASLKLGAMDLPYVEWAKALGLLEFESPALVADESADDAGDSASGDDATSEADLSVAPTAKKRGRPAKVQAPE